MGLLLSKLNTIVNSTVAEVQQWISSFKFGIVWLFERPAYSSVVAFILTTLILKIGDPRFYYNEVRFWDYATGPDKWAADPLARTLFTMLTNQIVEETYKKKVTIFTRYRVLFILGLLNLKRSSKKALLLKISSFLILLAALYCLSKYIIRKLPILLRESLSEILHKRSVSPKLTTTTVRKTFHSLVVPKSKFSDGHDHPASAASRESACAAIDIFASCLGMQSFYYQLANRDVKQFRAGSLTYHWGKDLVVAPSAKYANDMQVTAIIDTDYYMDMPTFLATTSLAPIIIYTLNPQSAAMSTGEFSFTFTNKGEIKYNVAGSGTYCHQLWDYNVDIIRVSATFLGVPYRTRFYLLDRKEVSLAHEIVCLTPITHFNWVWAILATFLEAPLLKRFNPIVTDADGETFVRINVQAKDGLKIVTGRPESYSTAVVPAVVDSAIAEIAKITVSPLLPAQIASFFPRDGMIPSESSKVQTPILTAYHRKKAPKSNAIVFPVELASRKYTFIPKAFQFDQRPTMQAFMSPFLHEGYNPTNSICNEFACVQGRVVLPQKADEPNLTPFLFGVMQEFIEILVPVPHIGCPLDLQHVWDSKPRPNQRSILADAPWTEVKDTATMFMKKEAYTKITDPRPITEYCPSMKLHYSSFVAAISEFVLRPCWWFAAAKTPLEIAVLIGILASNAESIDCSDFARLDGHIRYVSRLLERMLGTRFFKPEYIAEFIRLHSKQFDIRVITRFGIVYLIHAARGSGSEETCDFNSVTTAFIYFLAWRMSVNPSTGTFHTPTESYSKLGIYLGDDAVSHSVPSASMKKACVMMGQEITINTYPFGSAGVNFLSRIYGPHVWYGDTNSCCDLLRQLKKIHLTVQLAGVTPKMKFLEKVRAFELTDLNTPIIGDLVKKAKELHPAEILVDERLYPMRRWESLVSKENQYPNEGLWITELNVELLANEGISYDRFTTWLKTVENLEQILSPPLLRDPPGVVSKNDVVVDGFDHQGTDNREFDTDIDLDVLYTDHEIEVKNVIKDPVYMKLPFTTRKFYGVPLGKTPIKVRRILNHPVLCSVQIFDSDYSDEASVPATSPDERNRQKFYTSGFNSEPVTFVRRKHPILVSVQKLNFTITLLLCFLCLISFASCTPLEVWRRQSIIQRTCPRTENLSTLCDFDSLQLNDMSKNTNSNKYLRGEANKIKQQIQALDRDQSLSKRERRRIKKSFLSEVQTVGRQVVPTGSFGAGGAILGDMAGKAIGTALGGPVVGTMVSKATGALGKLLGDGLASIVGFGDYEVKSNSLFKMGASLPEGQQIPVFRNVGYATRIQHREFVANVYSPATPTAFTNNDYVINPADPNLFPWLSKVAEAFQQYKMKGMIVEFRSMSSDYSATSALGTVALATNYNVLDDKFSDMINAQTSQYATSSKPSSSHIHPIECAPEDTPVSMMYVRTPQSYSNATAQDDRLYDLGRLQVITEGLVAPAGSIIGQLYISYDVELYKPILPDLSFRTAMMFGLSGVTKTAVFGILTTTRGGAVAKVSPMIFKFLVPGNYIVVVEAKGTGLENITNLFGATNPSTFGAHNTFFLTSMAPLIGYQDGSGIADIHVAAIRADFGFEYDFTTQAALATTITSFELYVFPCSFEVLYGVQASASSFLHAIKSGVQTLNLDSNTKFRVCELGESPVPINPSKVRPCPAAMVVPSVEQCNCSVHNGVDLYCKNPDCRLHELPLDVLSAPSQYRLKTIGEKMRDIHSTRFQLSEVYGELNSAIDTIVKAKNDVTKVKDVAEGGLDFVPIPDPMVTYKMLLEKEKDLYKLFNEITNIEEIELRKGIDADLSVLKRARAAGAQAQELLESLEEQKLKFTD